VWRVWQTKQELVDYAKECCVIRQLTPAERQQYGLPACAVKYNHRSFISFYA
jgi:hypothetical protein